MSFIEKIIDTVMLFTPTKSSSTPKPEKIPPGRVDLKDPEALATLVRNLEDRKIAPITGYLLQNDSGDYLLLSSPRPPGRGYTVAYKIESVSKKSRWFPL